MTNEEYLNNIRTLIANNRLNQAIDRLNLLLKNSPKIDEVILQSSRLQEIHHHIRLGTVSHTEATLTKNQIRAGLLDLLREIGKQNNNPLIQQEIERTISIVNSKNVIAGSIISAGGDVVIGDRTIHTESRTSRRLRLFLYLFVPFLALVVTFLWQQMQPITLTVRLDNKTPNQELPFQKGTLTLYYGGKLDIKTIEIESTFTGIPRGKKVSLHFVSEGFSSVDTAFLPSDEHFVLPIKRDNSFATLSGTIKEEASGNPLEGVHVSIPCCETLTDAFGKFEFKIPQEHQRKEQRLEIDKEGYIHVSIITPVIKWSPPIINLTKKKQ